jgi:hypothetical protein
MRTSTPASTFEELVRELGVLRDIDIDAKDQQSLNPFGPFSSFIIWSSFPDLPHTSNGSSRCAVLLCYWHPPIRSHILIPSGHLPRVHDKARTMEGEVARMAHDASNPESKFFENSITTWQVELEALFHHTKDVRRQVSSTLLSFRLPPFPSPILFARYCCLETYLSDENTEWTVRHG